MLPTRTKIVCTMGPSVDSLEQILKLQEAGMNVARLNFSHGTHESHLKTIERLKEARRITGLPLTIVLDTKGPEMRLGPISGDQIPIKKGQKLLLHRASVLGSVDGVSVTPGEILDQAKPGTRILFDDGYIGSVVVECVQAGVIVEMENAGILKSRKSVNIPHARVHLPILTEKDRADVEFGCQQDIDILAASFVQSADDILIIKNLLKKLGKPETLVYAKIENAEGVDHFDRIIHIADGVMIARGDLGVEVPLSEVPILQKQMIRKAYLAGKGSVTATQMLESMIHNPRPTRAEVSDVANAIFDGTSAVMLSGETAVGQYPVETVAMMRSIVAAAEKAFPYRLFLREQMEVIQEEVPSSVTAAAVQTAYRANAQAIFAVTSSGNTACLLSRLHPSMPIIAMTPHQKIYHQLGICWGVIPYVHAPARSFDEAFANLSEFALGRGYVTFGDLVVIVTGSFFGVSGTTKTLTLENIGDVLVRGEQGMGKKVHGKVLLALASNTLEPYMARERILVVSQITAAEVPLMQQAAGVIVDLGSNLNGQKEEQQRAKLLASAQEHQIPLLIRTENGPICLRDGQLVTLDPEKGVVYKGIVVEKNDLANKPSHS